MGKFTAPDEKKKPGILRWIVAALAAVLALGLAVPAAWEAFAVRVEPGVSLGGLDLGGLSGRDARKKLHSAAQELSGEGIHLELPEAPVDLSLGELGWKLDEGAALRAARKASAGAVISLGDVSRYEQSALRYALEGWAEEHDTALTQPKWALSGPLPELGEEKFSADAPCPEVLVTLGTPERRLDVDAAVAAVEAALNTAFDSASRRVTLEVPVLAEPEAPDLGKAYEELCVQPVDAGLDMEAYAPIPGAYGCGFDMAEAEKLVAQGTYGGTVALPMAYLEPEIHGDGVYFRDELGVCETKHNTDENRNTNLRIICGILDGQVLEPGEEFSFNAVVGERTPERGFKPATVFSGTHLSKDYGGGACQTSSTLYNCALLADLEIVTRLCHGARVTYLPLGLDATVNWSTNTDFVFRNSSHFPVKIQAEVADGYVKMKLLGTDEKDYYIKMEANSGEDSDYIYTTTYKCRYDKATDTQISRTLEARSIYMKNLS